jgi:hypothetical protein
LKIFAALQAKPDRTRPAATGIALSPTKKLRKKFDAIQLERIPLQWLDWTVGLGKAFAGLAALLF